MGFPDRRPAPPGRAGWSRLGIVALTSILLAGCGLFDRSVPPPCPRVSILGDAAQMVVFRPGPGRDLTDVEYEGEISNVQPKCEYIKKNTVIDMTVTLELIATRGPAAATGKPGHLPFFVSVIERGTSRILGKATFDSALEFLPGKRRAGSSEEIAQTIPLGPGKTGVDYEILVGFQLTEEQLQYNRKQRGF